MEKHKPLETLRIDGSKDTPTVIFDQINNEFEISGRSFPLNTKGFYAPVMEWFEEYVKNPNPVTNFSFKLEYFNTPSSKSIIDILKMLKALMDKGFGAKVTWFYETEDVDIHDLGHVFSKIVGIPFEFKEC